MDSPDDVVVSEPRHPAETTEAVEIAPPRTPWTVRNLLVLLGCALLALFAANILALAGYMLLVPSVNLKSVGESLRYNAIFNLSILAVFHALLLGIIYLFLVVNYRLPFWGSLSWRRITSRDAAWSIVGGVAMAVLVQFAPVVLPSSEEFPLMKLFNSPTAGYAIAIFAVLLAPFMEELIFRGLLFAFFERLLGVPMAVVGTAALFAALHVSQYWGAWNHVVLIALVGFCFSLVRGVTGSVTPGYVLHTAYNAALIAGLYWQTDRFRNFPGALGQ